MAKDRLRVFAVIPASPENIYRAWLDGKEHSAFTGSKATVDANGRFTAWDGYIQGTTIDRHPGRRIVQTWRTSEFPKGSPDSRLEIQLERVAEGTRLTVIHTDIPEGQGEKYKSGWSEFYFVPMREYFAKFLRLEPPKRPPHPPSEPEVKATPVKAPKPAPPSSKKLSKEPSKQDAPKKQAAAKQASPKAKKSAAKAPAKKATKAVKTSKKR